MNSIKYLDRYGEETGWIDKSVDLGYYVGGGVNFRIFDSVAISIPLKLHLYTIDGYKEYYYNDSVSGFQVEWRPPTLLTVGLGIEYYPFARKSSESPKRPPR